MIVGLFDAIRFLSLGYIFDSKQTFVKKWDETYQSPILRHLEIDNERGFRSRLISLGGSISEIFGLGAQSVRGATDTSEAQSNISISGSAWERLITWYTNSLGCGLNMVALNKRGQTQHLPLSFKDAFQVTINNASTSSDLDVVLLNWIGPQNQEWMEETFDTGERKEMLRARKLFKEVFEQNPECFSVCVVSAKTNWNDSIQVPMLWSLVFTSGLNHPIVSVGRNQSSPEMFGHFTYGFATAPSNNIEGWNANNTPVIRASTMTAGSYWGRPENTDLRMLPLSEVFHRRTRMPNGAEVGSNLFEFISDEDGAEAFGLL